ncbi:sugar-binding protein [Phycisphaerales bacterium AB-hyl4]|uniref:Sugar-binding protein n=1 Tax=Natronomicrosphaera hydrolytica TaxID=3242702 RepID=A0ABV4UCP3_9BACT
MTGLLYAVASTHAISSDRQVDVLSFDQPPEIDGRLDDDCWQAGQWYSDFIQVDPSQQSAEAQTRFKVGADAHTLYIGAVLDRPEGAPLVTEASERDGPVWRDDAIEFMIDPAPSVDQYVHIVVNAAGVIYDALRVQGGNLADRTVDIHADVATHVEDDQWSIEIAIPLAELGLSPDTTGDWALNVARSSHDGPSQTVSSYAPIRGTLHQPHRFVPLVLENLDATPFQWAVASQGQSRVVEDQGQLFLETGVSVRNETDRYEFFRMRFGLNQGESRLGELTELRGLDAGASRVYQVRIPFEGEGNVTVDVALENVRTDVLVRRHQYAAQLHYTPLKITLSAPSYRNTIYDTQSLDELRGTVEINLSSERLAQSELAVLLLDADRQAIETTTITSPKRNVDFEMPLPADLPQGEYHVVAELTTPERDDAYEAGTALRRLGPPPAGGREVRLDANKVTLVDGEPFLPMGAMGIRPHDDMEVVAKQGYTVVFEYAFYWWDESEQQAWLDRVHDNGLMAMIYPYPDPVMVRDGRPQQPVSDEEEQQIRTFINRWKDHPALLAWYLADEPELHSTLPERLEKVYQICQEEDPYRPTVVLNNTFSGVDIYGASADILMPNPFPGFYEDGGARRHMEYIYRLVGHAGEAVDGSRGVWVTPQAFSWADLRDERQDERAPTFRDLRNMNYQAVVAGSTGHIPFAYNRGRRHPAIRLGLGYLATEMALLKDAVLAVDSARQLDVSAADGQVLHTLRQANDQYYLFVVNVSDQAQELTATLPSDAPTQWYVVSEDDSLQLEEGRRLNETLSPLAVRIYTTDGDIAGTLSVERMQSAIDNAPTFDDPDEPMPEAEIKAITEF